MTGTRITKLLDMQVMKYEIINIRPCLITVPANKLHSNENNPTNLREREREREVPETLMKNDSKSSFRYQYSLELGLTPLSRHSKDTFNC